MLSQKLYGKRLKIGLGGAILFCFVFLAIFADVLSPYDPYAQNLFNRLKPPVWYENGSWLHLLGTDNYGRDLLSRLLHGSRISILVGFSAMVLSCFLGTTLGLFAGYLGGRVEQIIMRFADAHMAIPEILLAVLIASAIGGSTFNLIFVLGISGWMVYARVAFSLCRSYRERPFVEASVSFGASGTFIIFHHILPQIVPILTVISTLQVAQMILQETALSFLGLGVPAPAATWGNMLAEGRDRMWVAPWIANLSGVAIIVLVWGVNMLGNGLREYLDPKSKELK